jgi:ABC-type enterochelin transport system permease subunit
MYSSEKKRLILLKNFFQKTGFALVTTYRAKLFVFMSNSSSKRKYKPEKETGHIIIIFRYPHSISYVCTEVGLAIAHCGAFLKTLQKRYLW